MTKKAEKVDIINKVITSKSKSKWARLRSVLYLEDGREIMRKAATQQNILLTVLAQTPPLDIAEYFLYHCREEAFMERNDRGQTPLHVAATYPSEDSCELVEALLDLHQTSCATPPVAVVHDDPTHLRMAAAMGVAHAVVGIESVYSGTMLGRWIDSVGGVGLTVETGQKGREEARAAAFELSRRFLTAGAAASAQGGRIRRYRLRAPWISPADGVTFARALGNTSRVSAGEVIGHTDDGPLRCEEEAVIFLPRIGATRGTPCMLLASDEGLLTV